jgi:hypothetical protein
VVDDKFSIVRADLTLIGIGMATLANKKRKKIATRHCYFLAFAETHYHYNFVTYLPQHTAVPKIKSLALLLEMNKNVQNLLPLGA